ncbi:MAG TPA: hypothetical protein VGJ30_01125, partial [Candidatus Angelobacter sp.]
MTFLIVLGVQIKIALVIHVKAIHFKAAVQQCYFSVAASACLNPLAYLSFQRASNLKTSASP